MRRRWGHRTRRTLWEGSIELGSSLALNLTRGLGAKRIFCTLCFVWDPTSRVSSK